MLKYIPVKNNVYKSTEIIDHCLQKIQSNENLYHCIKGHCIDHIHECDFCCKCANSVKNQVCSLNDRFLCLYFIS